jgi:HK97 family phage major capsid protein
MEHEFKELTDQIVGSIDKIDQKHGERGDELEGRVDELEAMLSGSAGPWSGGQSRRTQENERKALITFGATGEVDKNHLELATKAQSLSGGLQIHAPKILSDAIEKFEKDSLQLPQLVKNVGSPSGDYRINVRVDPPIAETIDETGVRSETAAAVYRIVNPPGGGLYSVIANSNWYLTTSKYPPEQEIASDVGIQNARKKEQMIIHGTGTGGEIRGFLNTAPTADADFASPLRDPNALQYVDAPAPDTLLQHLLDTYFTLNPAYRQRAAWLMNSQTLAQVRGEVGSNGQPIFQENYGTGVDAGEGTLFGKPVYISEYMPNLAESPLNFPIAVGDWQAMYTLVNVGTPFFVRDPYTQKGFTHLYYEQRILGSVVNNDAVKLVRR